MTGKLILIGGISRSGKSTLAKNLVSELENSVHLEQDLFVQAQENLPRIKDRIDWDSPDSIDWSLWKRTIAAKLEQHDWVLAEGIFAFNQLELIERADYTISLSLDRDLFLEERKADTRWGKEPDWFLDHVWKAHQQHHNPHSVSFNLDKSRKDTPSADILVQKIINKK